VAGAFSLLLEDPDMRRLLQLLFVLATLTWGTLLWRAMGGVETPVETRVRTVAVAAMFVTGWLVSTARPVGAPIRRREEDQRCPEGVTTRSDVR
jgi:hypothetical protein